MAKHRLSWRQGRATAQVDKVGTRSRKTTGGKIIAQRPATQREERQIARGQWVTTRPPGQPNLKSQVRPQQAAKQKNPKTDKG